jgi:hypothetical protein
MADLDAELDGLALGISAGVLGKVKNATPTHGGPVSFPPLLVMTNISSYESIGSKSPWKVVENIHRKSV